LRVSGRRRCVHAAGAGGDAAGVGVDQLTGGTERNCLGAFAPRRRFDSSATTFVGGVSRRLSSRFQPEGVANARTLSVKV